MIILLDDFIGRSDEINELNKQSKTLMSKMEEQADNGIQLFNFNSNICRLFSDLIS